MLIDTRAELVGMHGGDTQFLQAKAINSTTNVLEDYLGTQASSFGASMIRNTNILFQSLAEHS